MLKLARFALIAADTPNAFPSKPPPLQK